MADSQAVTSLNFVKTYLEPNSLQNQISPNWSKYFENRNAGTFSILDALI